MMQKQPSFKADILYHLPKPGKFTYAIVDRYCLVMIFTMMTAIILSILGLTIGTGELGGSWTNENDIRVKRVYAFDQAWDDYQTATNDENIPERTDYFGSIYVVFESKTNNIYAVNNLYWIDQGQRKVTEIKGYDEHCQLYESKNDTYNCYPPTTITNFVWTAKNPSLYDCDCSGEWSDIPCQVTDFNFTYYKDGDLPSSENTYLPIITEVCNSSNIINRDSCEDQAYDYRNNIMSIDTDCKTGDSTYVRTSFALGLPLEGYTSPNKDYSDQYSDYDDWFGKDLADAMFKMKSYVENHNSDLTVYFEGDNWDLSFYYLNNDLVYVAMSFILVFTVILLQTGSIFLTSTGMLHVIISFPVGLFVWYVVFQEEYVTYLMYMGIFVILGIGADDIFVLLDAWKQGEAQIEQISGDMHIRMLWAWKRSAGSMLVTSLTTLVAFLAAASSTIWDIRCFGIVNGVTVMANYILVITWYPACVICYEKNLANRCIWKDICCKFSKKKKSSDSSQFDNSNDIELVDVEKKEDEDENENENVNENENENEEDENANNSDNENEEDENENENEHINIEDAVDGIHVENKNTPPDNFISKSSRRRHEGDFDHVKLRPIERYFYNEHYQFIAKYHWFIILVFFILMIVTSVIWTTGLEADENAPSPFADDSFVSKSERITDELFYSSSSVLPNQLRLVWGIRRNHPINIADAHPADPFYRGVVKYDDNFDLYQNQDSMIVTCNALLKKYTDLEYIPEGDGVYCPMIDFKSWRINQSLPFPVTSSENDFITAVQDWQESDLPFGFLNLSASDPNYETSSQIIFDPDNPDTILWAYASINTTLDTGWDNKLGEYHDYYDAAEDVVDDNNDNFGDTFECYQYNFFWWWMVGQEVFLTSSINNLVIGFSLSIVILSFATRNWRLIGIAAFSLYTIISFTFGLMMAAEWKVNVLESICITIAAGLAVDYTVHILHTYDESAGTKEERVRSALVKMAISIVSGYVTTFFAAMSLFFCELLFFSLFGQFITMVISSAILVALFLLPSLLFALGPNEGEADIPIPEFITNIFPSLKEDHENDISTNDLEKV